MPTLRLDCMPFFRELTTRVVPGAVALANGATRNKAPFCEMARELTRLQELLQRLGGRSVVAAEVEGCTILQQVRRAALDATDLCQQYEDQALPGPTVVFQEVYNGQLRQVLGRLRVVVETLATINVQAPTVQLPRVLDLTQQILERPVVDYSRSCPLGAMHSVLQELEDHAAGQPQLGPLALAAQGHWVKLEQVLGGDASAAKAAGPSLSALHGAVMWQEAFPVAALLSYGANPNCKSEGNSLFPNGSTPLHVAATLGSVPMLRLLLAWGADPAVRDGCGRTPAMVAATLAAREVFDNAVQLVTRCREACSFAFHEQFGQLRRLLNECDLPLNIKFKAQSKYFLIHQVAHGGSVETCEMLVEYGASTLLRAQDMELPSQVAEERCHVVAMGALQRRQQAELDWLNDLSPRQAVLNGSLSQGPAPSSIGSRSTSPAVSPGSSPSTSPHRRLHGVMHSAKEKLAHLSPCRQRPAPAGRTSPTVPPR